MTIQNKIFAKASFAFLCGISLSGFLNYITLTFLAQTGIHNTWQCIGHFIIYFFQVEAALLSIYYGFLLVRYRKKQKSYWHESLSETPNDITGMEKSKVIFLTIDGSLYNGTYHTDKRMFYAYDGMDYPLEEVYMWCIQTRSLALKNYMDRLK